MRMRSLDLLALTAVIAMAFLFGFRHIVDGDLFYHIANGRDILSQGGLPQTNTYIWAPSDRPYYPNPAWLFGVVLAMVEKMGGLTGVVLLKTLVVVAIFLVLFIICRRHGGGPILTSIFLLVFGMGSAFRLTDRPHLFSLLFFALCLLLIDHRQRGTRIFWILPPLFAVWANIHSGFILGLLLLGVFLCGELLDDGWQKRRSHVKRLATVTALCLAATFFVPHPLTNLLFLLQLFEPRSYPIGEYLSPRLFDFFWFYVPATILMLWAIFRRFWPRVWAWGLLVPLFFVLGCVFARFIPYFLMAALPWTVQSISVWREQSRFSKSYFDGAWISLGGAALLVALPLIVLFWTPVPTGLGAGVDSSVAPMGSVRFLNEVKLMGRLYNSQSYGGVGAMYLTTPYRMYQSAYFQVEKDRIEEAYLASKTASDWQNFLDRLNIEVVWLDTGREPHSLEYYPQAKWALVYFDDDSVVYVRRYGQNAVAVASLECRVANPALLNATSDQQELDDPFVSSVGLSEARRLLSYNPDNRLALSMTALFLSRQPGRENEALEVLNALEVRDPTYADVYFEKGRLLARLGRLEEAEQALSKYLQLSPDDPEGYIVLAGTLTSAGMPGRAVELLQRVTEQFPDQGQGYLMLGGLQLNANDLDAAWGSLSRARELLVDNAEVYNLLGIVAAQRGDLSAAVAFFRQALVLDSAYESAQRNLQRALGEVRTEQ